MARIICIDYGGKRTGIAVTDPLQIIATALTTIETQTFIPFLKNYCQENEVCLFLIGEPKGLNDAATHATELVQKAVKELRKHFPQIPIKTIDERFSSKMASRAMLEMGMKKKKRQIKGNTDQIAATMLLQEYLDNPAVADDIA